jgi:hypothetical integral membrane protein (TIGR02206 family)
MRSTPDLNFQFLGVAHLAILATIPGITALLVWWTKRRTVSVSTVRRALGVILLVSGPGWYLYTLLCGGLRFPDCLPISICDATLMTSVFALFTLRSWAFELAYYHSFGALMAVVTPALWEPFPSPSTIQFFAGHCAVVISILFLTCGGILRPRIGSARRAFLVLNGIVTAVAGFNLFFQTNYLYLRDKPVSSTLLDLLGPWPFYLIACELIVFAVFRFLEGLCRSGAGGTAVRMHANGALRAGEQNSQLCVRLRTAEHCGGRSFNPPLLQ